jgi:sec-independent protein translocase protein TatB
MSELSFAKLLLLARVALVALGPEKLPKAARMAGAMLRRLRLGWESVRSEVERELEIEEIRRAAKETADRADAMRKAADTEMLAAHASVNRTVAEVTNTADAPPGEMPAIPKESHDGGA